MGMTLTLSKIIAVTTAGICQLLGRSNGSRTEENTVVMSHFPAVMTTAPLLQFAVRTAATYRVPTSTAANCSAYCSHLSHPTVGHLWQSLKFLL